MIKALLEVLTSCAETKWSLKGLQSLKAERAKLAKKWRKKAVSLVSEL